MIQITPLPLSVAQKLLKDRREIPAMLAWMERMSGPALEALGPIVFDVVKLKNQPCAAATLSRLLTLRRAWANQTEEECDDDSGSNNVLQAAVWLGRTELVNILLGVGAKTDHINQNGMGVLDVAASMGAPPDRQKDIAEALLQKGQFTQLQKDLALYRAAETGNMGMARSLLAHGAGFGTSTKKGTAMAEACFHVGFDYPAMEIVGAMLETEAGRAVIDDGWGKSSGAPIHSLAYRGGIEVMSMMIAAGASVNAPIGLNTANPDTPLMAAARGMNPEAIALLLIAGADAGAIDSDGGNALHHLANSYVISTDPRREMRSVELLASAGAAPFLRNGNGQSPLDVAREMRRDIIASTLGAIVSSTQLKSATANPATQFPAPSAPRF